MKTKALFDTDVFHFGALTKCLVLAASLAACTHSEPLGEVSDPYEAANRAAHDINLKYDSILFGNRSKTGVLPEIPTPMVIGFSNFADNFSLPTSVLNDLLQLKFGPAMQNTLRFAVNSTVGIGGIFDPASKVGIDADTTGFGETLYVWGVPEGNYLEIPYWGPSTERDWSGAVVDMFTNPLYYYMTLGQSVFVETLVLGSDAGNRQRFSETYESVLYDSADSYDQVKLQYMQNRRFELGIEEDVVDPNEDPYAQ